MSIAILINCVDVNIRSVLMVIVVALIVAGGSILQGCSTNRQIATVPVKLPSKISSSDETPALKITGSLLDMVKDEEAARLVKEALENNYDLKSTALRLKSPGLLLAVTASQKFPKADAGYSFSRADQMEESGAVETAHKVSISASWELDLWGKIADEHQAAIYGFEAGELEYQMAMDSLAARVLQGYFNVKAQKLKLDIHKKRVAIYKNIEESILANYQAGLGSLDDLATARTRTEIANSDMAEAMLLHDDSVREVEIFLGRYPDGGLNFSGELPDVESPAPSVPASILETRPDIQAAIRQFKASERSASVAQKAMLPDIVISADIFRDNRRLEKLGASSNGWSLAGNLLYPVFNRGRVKSEAKAAQAEAEALYMDFASKVIQAMREAENTFSKERYLKIQLEHLDKAAQNAEKSSRYYEKRYREGLENIISLHTAQEQELSILSSIIDLRAARIVNRIDMALSLGTGVNKKGE